MTNPWLTIVGLGEDGLQGLAGTSANAIQNAEILVGSERLHAMVPEHSAQRLTWPRPFSPMIPQLGEHRGKCVVVLATGDPLNYGIARKLLQQFTIDEIRILPHLSSFSLAAARLGWSLPDLETLTLHGRDNASIEPYIQPGTRLLALTDGDASVRETAHRLSRRRFGESQLTVLEHMGGEAENRVDFTAGNTPEKPFADLLTLAIHCIAGPDAQILPRTPGLPDDAFTHDGQLTKREVRATTLAALMPAPGATLWDVGAGCGSVAIEWMRATSNSRAIAFERNSGRIAMIEQNRDALGTPLLKIVPGDLPDTLQDQPSPNAIFIGGDVSNAALFDACWTALKPHGRLVANAVTLEGETHLIALQESHGGELVRISVETQINVGRKRAMRPRMTVTQWRITKSADRSNQHGQ